MSNKFKPEHGTPLSALVGQGDPTKTDLRLSIGWAANDDEPVLDVGDVASALVDVWCHCGQLVGRVKLYDRSARKLPPVRAFTAQITTDATTRPVITREVLNLLTPRARLVADCPAHGRQSIRADALLERSRRAEGRAPGSVGRLNLRRVDPPES